MVPTLKNQFPLKLDSKSPEFGLCLFRTISKLFTDQGFIYLNYWNNSCVFWLHEFVSPPPVSPANASACSGGGEATTGKPFGKISNLGLTEGGVL